MNNLPLRPFDVKIITEISSDYQLGKITAKQGAARAEIVLGRYYEKHHTEILKILPKEIVLKIGVELMKFAGIFMAGHRLKNKCFAIAKGD